MENELTQIIKDIARDVAHEVVDEKLKNTEKFGDTMTYQQVSRYLESKNIHVSVSTIRQYASEGRLVKIGSGRGVTVTKKSVNSSWGIE